MIKNLLTVSLLITVICFPGNTYAQADKLSRSEVKQAMKSFEDMGLSREKEKELRNASDKAVDRIFDIAESDDDPDTKMRKFREAQLENRKLFEGVLDDKSLKKYKKNVTKKMRPLKRKANFVKFLL